MKTNFLYAAAVLLLMTTTLSSCFKDKCDRELTYLKRTPIALSPSEYRVDIENQAGRALESAGKIYVAGNYILVNEPRKGIHIIDNTDPRSPQAVSFISIIGNVDMAVRGNILYADNYTDLLAIDISNPTEARLMNRVQNVFPNYGTDENGNVIVAYDEEWVTEKVACNQWDMNMGGVWIEDGQVFQNNAETGQATVVGVATSASDRAPSSNVAGSMARFAVVDDALYIIDHSNMHIFDISAPISPSLATEMNIGWSDIETIYPFGNFLFIGSQNGMMIYDKTNPLNPVYRSTFTHAQACDPVVVEGNRAYVTLRDGVSCFNFNNQMDIVDISNIDNPTLISSTQMTNPHGLSVSNNLVYLCDGRDGFKIYDASNPNTVESNRLAHVTGFHAYDAIKLPNTDIVVLIGENGLYQFDVTTPSAPEQLSLIPVVQ